MAAVKIALSRSVALRARVGLHKLLQLGTSERSALLFGSCEGQDFSHGKRERRCVHVSHLRQKTGAPQNYKQQSNTPKDHGGLPPPRVISETLPILALVTRPRAFLADFAVVSFCFSSSMPSSGCIRDLVGPSVHRNTL